MKNLRRDTLDYLLTDTTPVEISELFTYSYLYNYLHKSKKQIDIIAGLLKDKEVNTFKDVVPFGNDGSVRSWLTTPLTFNIVKADGYSLRKMSLPQPVSALNMYFFISLYQKDILNIFDSPPYSVRFHARNNDLVYKTKNRAALIDYQYRRNKRSKKVVEQTGRFFDIAPFHHVVDLERSPRWSQANLNYRLLCKLDFKRCFDSIYSHSYKWIVTRDVVDAKGFKNSSLYAVIDRILQNINGASSNGVLVGPEFSRMIVEVLLQQIDREVCAHLLQLGLRQGDHYEMMRFVDDTYVFTNDENTQVLIVKTIDDKARTYLLELNQLKVDKQVTPYFRGNWINDVERYKDKLLRVFRTNKAISITDETFQVAPSHNDFRRLVGDFEYLIATHKSHTVTVTNYIMSVLMNSMAGKNRKYTFFKTTTHKTIASLLEFVFYVYCHSINFKNTQKLISILYYCHSEVDLKSSKNLQSIIHKYEQTIAAQNYSDYINLLVAFDELDVHFSLQFEERIFARIKAADDPVALATYLSYCKYNSKLMQQVSREVDDILAEKYSSVRKERNEMQYREFWYLLMFNKCPYINKNMQAKYNSTLKKMVSQARLTPADQTIKLIAEFLLDKNEQNSFISWNIKGARMLEEITYRTHNKTVFNKDISTFVVSL